MDHSLILYINCMSDLDYGFTFCGKDSSLRKSGFINGRDHLPKSVSENKVTTVIDNRAIKLHSNLNIKFVPLCITYDRLVDEKATSSLKIAQLPQYSLGKVTVQYGPLLENYEEVPSTLDSMKAITHQDITSEAIRRLRQKGKMVSSIIEIQRESK